ncbi:MAG: sporulation transcription factor Spo0A [Limnochordales bacterium]|nr:sporulation transcription factor Spo0A [Limnochordales bacterium]
MTVGKPIGLLVADADRNFTDQFTEYLRKTYHPFVLLGVVTDGPSVVRACERQQPDILLLDLVLPEYDGLAVLEQLKERTFLDRTKLVIHTALYDESVVTRCVTNYRVAYFAAKPLQLSLLLARLREVARGELPAGVGDEMVRGVRQLEEAAMDHLTRLGIPAHYKGYQYLKDAIRLTVVSPELLSPITKRLYRIVAERHATSPDRVERSIRHAIETACTRGNLEFLQALFSYSVDRERGKPSNSLFIARLADKIRVESR